MNFENNDVFDKKGWIDVGKITRMEMREKCMIVSRTSLISICADHAYSTAHRQLTDASYHGASSFPVSCKYYLHTYRDERVLRVPGGAVRRIVTCGNLVIIDSAFLLDNAVATSIFSYGTSRITTSLMKKGGLLSTQKRIRRCLSTGLRRKSSLSHLNTNIRVFTCMTEKS